MFGEGGGRRHMRIREDIPVRWRVERSGRQGEGIVRNLSISGMLLESKSLSPSEKNAEFSIETTDPGESFFIPSHARFVWGKAAQSDKGYYFCGLQFIRPSVDAVQAIEGRVESRLQKISDCGNMNVLDNNLGSYKEGL